MARAHHHPCDSRNRVRIDVRQSACLLAYSLRRGSRRFVFPAVREAARAGQVSVGLARRHRTARTARVFSFARRRDQRTDDGACDHSKSGAARCRCGVTRARHSRTVSHVVVSTSGTDRRSGMDLHLLLGRDERHRLRVSFVDRGNRRVPMACPGQCGLAVRRAAGGPRRGLRGSGRRVECAGCGSREPAYAVVGSRDDLCERRQPRFQRRRTSLLRLRRSLLLRTLAARAVGTLDGSAAATRHQHARSVRSVELARAFGWRFRFQRSHEPKARSR